MTMPRESKKARRERAEKVYDLLGAEYPDAHCELDHENAFQLAVATILSAQTTDVRVNMVTPQLFKRYPDAEALANAQQEDVEEIVRSPPLLFDRLPSFRSEFDCRISGDPYAPMIFVSICMPNIEQNVRAGRNSQ